MTSRILVLAAAATIVSAAPRIVSSQAIPDKPAPAPTTAAAADTTKDIDPVGTYTTYITAQGQSLTTTMRVDKKDGGGYTGTLTADGIPPLPVNSVTVTGNKVKFSITAPDGSEAIINMVVKGEDITGSWSMAGDGSSLTGKRVPEFSASQR